MKKIVQPLFLLLALPFWFWWKLFGFFGNAEPAFQATSQCLSLVPGRIGAFLRAAFYHLSLPDSSQDTHIGFLTTFSHPKARLHPHVSTGVSCNFGWVDIGEDCIFASMVCVASGKKQHGFSSPDTPIRLQEGEKTRISIGRDCWVGASAVILADIGEGSVVAAGSVVVQPVPPFSIVAGNPAKVIGSRANSESAAIMETVA